MPQLKNVFNLPQKQNSVFPEFLHIEVPGNTRKSKIRDNYKIVILQLIISFLCYLQFEICNKNYLFNGFIFTFVNIFMVYSFIAVFGLFVVKRWISSIVVSLLSTLISIINFYTVLFRNQPASPLDIHNIGTAADVLGSYKLTFTWTIFFALLIFLLNFIFIFKLRKVEKKVFYDRYRYINRIIIVILVTFLFYYVTFFASFSIKPKLTLVWSWEESYHDYGYLASSEELLAKSFNVVRKPENYDEGKLKEISSKNTAINDKVKPDIILILNETFFDLRNVCDLKTDKSFMPYTDSLENKIYGYSVVPGNGGGTNRSEYELLTSNTLELMPGITPFSFLELKGASSVVSFLEDKGYSTWGSHCAPSLNYSRGTAYPKLGFDKYLFNDDYGKIEIFGKRPYASDKFVYDKMIQEYESMGDGPRFMYNLTIQNHGGWDMNGEEFDIIHTKNDFGEYTDDVNEYLSCIYMADSAFKYLVEYFENSGRDVIICMVGDHSPTFTSDIIKTDTKDEFEKIKPYATPFVIWANFEINAQNVGYTGLPYIAPMLFKTAGLGLSPFYEHMMKMFKEYPIITANGIYSDKKYNLFKYNSKDCPDLINTYFDMVYNNASNKAKKIDSLFSGKNK